MVPTRMRDNHAEDAQSYECETTTGTNKNGEKSGWCFFESGYFMLMGPFYVSLYCSLVVIFSSFSLHFHLFPLRSRPPAPSVYPQCPLQCCRWPLWEMREITEDFYPSDPDTPFFFSSQLDAAHARVPRPSPTSFYENMLLMFGRPCSLLVSWCSHPVVITASLRLQQDSICISTGLCLPFPREKLPTQIPPPHTYYFQGSDDVDPSLVLDNWGRNWDADVFRGVSPLVTVVVFVWFHPHLSSFALHNKDPLSRRKCDHLLKQCLKGKKLSSPWRRKCSIFYSFPFCFVMLSWQFSNSIVLSSGGIIIGILLYQFPDYCNPRCQ